ncbi:MAG: hypothetical protein K6C05_08765 [Anaerovibrio sp.]|uniref:RNA dependent RNA polymerase n=1 Tax=Anaerovibrio sp. TaxID=1872532 RepID=UPI0025E89981|nr:hypothetical protein [Anaerovibrio sp.]MCR5176923.1 hypothetical protein [Anaerovibrio sp.]
MGKKDKYHQLLTLNAKKIVNDTYSVHTEQNGIITLEFRCNLIDGLVGNQIVQHTDNFGSNALFDQMLQVLPESDSPLDKKRLQQHIVFLDFAEIFNTGMTINADDNKEIQREAEIRSDAGLGYRLEQLFSHGIMLSFDGDKWKHFVPFDKSNSMARQSRISFVDADIKEQLDKRLLLDMDFSQIQLIPSKYYAYRGLYMSTSCRIEQSEEFCLNEESVIVLPDKDNNEYKIKERFFTEIKETGEGQENQELKFGNRNLEIGMEFFDGEGLLCPEYAAYISDTLETDYGFEKPSNSFQIRMPFTKGMLHKVDYVRFFSEMAGKKTPLEIKDVFGISRDIRKAKILLTKGMFKCFKWLKEWSKKAGIEDPMQYFFDKMQQYSHTLYVTGTDARLSNWGKVRLNYQFLSTLDITPDDFTSLMSGHIDKIKAIDELFAGNEVQAGAKSLLRGGNSENPDKNNFSDESEKQAVEPDLGEREKCLWALGKNPAFINDPKVKEILKNMRQASARNLCRGQIDVSGEQRYLSRDLLRLMMDILWQVGKDNEEVNDLLKENWPKWSKKCLYRSSRHFYMPEAKGRLKLKADKYYAFFRNPHLSRHEQCIMRPFVNSSVYDTYFSDLTGVVMVSYESLVPMILGGADFDGDLVKIVSDRRIVEAVMRGAYNYTGKKKTKEYNRKEDLPAIKIPSRNGKVCKTPGTIPFEVILNTFSNQIGQISNLAVRIAEKEYGRPPEEVYKNKCAECTIVTGMEIDAAKTGVHPTKNIEDLKKLGKEKSLFLEAKDAMNKLARAQNFTPHVKEEKDGTLSLYNVDPRKFKYAKPILKNVNVCSCDDEVANIERLPGAYLNYIRDYSIRQEEIKDNKREKSSRQKPICFIFQKDEQWADALDKEKKKEVKLLMGAYQEIRTRDFNLKKFRRLNKESSYWGHIYRILQVQYDSFYQLLPCGMDVEQACAQVYMTISNFLKDSDSIGAALDRLAEKKWHFTPKDKRYLRLKEILGEGIDVPEAGVELLSNFNNNGFMLLYYLLKELQNRVNENIDIETYKSDVEGLEEKEDENKYITEFEEIYSRHLKQNVAWAVWHGDIIGRCREILEEILGRRDIEEAIKYVWAGPQAYRRNFFWNVFTKNELEANILAVNPANVSKKEGKADVG